jgi:hypothetical protein
MTDSLQNPIRTRITWTVLGLFAVLSLALSWPLVAHLGDRLPGTATWAFDESTFVWNIWHFKHTLLDLHASPLHSELIWYPLGIDLILYTFNFFNALIALPLQLAISLPVASNLTLLLAMTLSGLGAYLLAYYVLRIAYYTDRDADNTSRTTQYGLRSAAFLAGLIYAFASNRVVYAALGHYDMVTTQWLPFYALYLLKTLREPKLKNAVMAGLFFALAALAEMIFASFLALLTIVIVLATWRARSGVALVAAGGIADKNVMLSGLTSPGPQRIDSSEASPSHVRDSSLLSRRDAPFVVNSLRVTAAAISKVSWPAIFGRLALAALVALLIWSPVLVPIAREFLTGDYALTGWGESVKLSADVVGLVTPTELNPLRAGSSGELGGTRGNRWQAALRQVEEGKGQFGDINTVFLGYVTLALALLGAWRGRGKLRPWIWSALVFGVLCLGPLLQINGRYRFSLDGLLPEGVTMPLPFALLHFIPFINANRAPNRNSVILMLALAVLAAYGAAWLLKKLVDKETGKQGDKETSRQGNRETSRQGNRETSRQGNRETSRQGNRGTSLSTCLLVYLSTCLLALLILAEHLAIPLPTTDARVPAIYSQIAAEAGDFAVMQLPLGWRNSFGVLGSEQTQLQCFQTVHGKPMIGGNISRAPAFKMDYFRRIPLFRALTDLEMYQAVTPETDTAARSQAASLMALYDVRYFITTPPIPDRYPYQDTWKQTEDYALSVLPLERPAFWEQDGYRAYRVIQPAVPFPFRLDLGTTGTEPYVGAGWDYRTDEQPYGATGIWATATTADLYLPLDAASSYAPDRNSPSRFLTLRLAIAPLIYEGAAAQKVTISFNGLPGQEHILRPGWQIIEENVPDFTTRRGPNRVTLTFAWAKSPRQAFPDGASRAVIGGTGTVSPVNLDVHSFSEAFISAFAADGSEKKVSAGRRGYNVAVFDPRTGKLIESRGFDTAANTFEADALAAYLTAIPQGRIVVLATKGDATAHLTPAAVAALRGIGSRVDAPVALAGQAHALVGVQGAIPGAAAEAIGPKDVFLRVAGDFRTLAAAVDWVEVGP